MTHLVCSCSICGCRILSLRSVDLMCTDFAGHLRAMPHLQVCLHAANSMRCQILAIQPPKSKVFAALFSIYVVYATWCSYPRMQHR